MILFVPTTLCVYLTLLTLRQTLPNMSGCIFHIQLYVNASKQKSWKPSSTPIGYSICILDNSMFLMFRAILCYIKQSNRWKRIMFAIPAFRRYLSSVIKLSVISVTKLLLLTYSFHHYSVHLYLLWVATLSASADSTWVRPVVQRISGI